MDTFALTRREKEVSELVAQGLTNKEIAARLFISERTAESHVEQIRSKLGFHSRTQIAAWVVAGQRPAPRPPVPAVLTSAPWRRRVRIVLAAATVVTVVVIAVAALAGGRPGSPVRNPVIVTIAGNGQSAFSRDGGRAVATSLVHPVAVAVGPAGDVYIAEGNRIRRVDRNGLISTLAGTGTAGDLGEDGQAVQAQLDQPQGLAVDAGGDVYIADTFNHRVMRVGSDGLLRRVAGTGQGGSAGDGGSARAARLDLPTGLAIGPAGTLYVADTASNVVREVDSNGMIRTAAGTGEAGYRGEGGPALFALMHGPAGLAFDEEGNLFIADTVNDRVRRVDPNGIIDTVAGTGEVGFAGDGAAATYAELNLASNPLDGVGGGLAADSSGNLFIADAGNHRVRRVDVHGTITTVAGASAAGDVGDGGPALAALMGAPIGVAVDALGSVYIADGEANRVRQIAP